MRSHQTKSRDDAVKQLTVPITASTSLELEAVHVFMRNRRSLENSTMADEVSCLKSALYPNVKILQFDSSASSASQPGQKLSGLRCQDQVPCDVPPRPWTKIKSTRGSRGECTSERPSLLTDGDGDGSRAVSEDSTEPAKVDSVGAWSSFAPRGPGSIEAADGPLREPCNCRMCSAPSAAVRVRFEFEFSGCRDRRLPNNRS